MKKCKICGIEKLISNFYKFKDMKDGYRNECKNCLKIRSVNNARASGRWHSEQHREYLNKNRAKINKASRERRLSNIFKANARELLNRRIRDKKIIKPKACEFCEAEKELINGHHEDYSKPVDVWWLCSYCHGIIHSIQSIEPINL